MHAPTYNVKLSIKSNPCSECFLTIHFLPKYGKKYISSFLSGTTDDSKIFTEKEILKAAHLIFLSLLQHQTTNSDFPMARIRILPEENPNMNEGNNWL